MTTKTQQPPTKADIDKAMADAVRMGNLHRTRDILAAYNADPNATLAGHPLLMLAGKLKKPDMMSYLLAAGANPDQPNPDGDTALTQATVAQKGEFVQLLLDSGANLLLKNDAGFAAADIALQGSLKAKHVEEDAHQRQIDEAEVKVAAWGKVLAPIVAHKDFDLKGGCNGKPYINFAVEAATPEVVSVLLSRGVDVNSTDTDGNTPLTLAARDGRADFANILLEKGADVNALNNAGENAVAILLRKAAKMLADEADMYDFDIKRNRVRSEAREALAAQLINLPAFDAKGTSKGQPYIGLAAAGTGTQAVDALLQKGANINAEDANGDTPLLQAARAGNQAMAEYLIQKGADPLHANKAGETVQSIALKNYGDFIAVHDDYKHREHKAKLGKLVTWALDQKGYNTEAASSGMTLLALAARLDTPAAMETLLKKRAKIDGQHEGGFTPLMSAVQLCKQDYATTLLARGARLDIATDAGETVIGTALKGTVDLMDSLETEDGMTSEMMTKRLEPWEKMIELLSANRGYDPDAMGGGSPLLALAARFNSAATLQSLLEAGAKVEAPAANGDTALMVATRCCHPEHAQLLLKAGASAFTRNKAGENAQKMARDMRDAFLKTKPAMHKTWDDHETTRQNWEALVDMLSSQQENIVDTYIAPTTEAVAVRNKPFKLKAKAPS